MCRGGIETLRTASKTERGQGAGRGSNSTAIVHITAKVDKKSAVLAFCEYLPQSYKLSLYSGLT